MDAAVVAVAGADANAAAVEAESAAAEPEVRSEEEARRASQPDPAHRDPSLFGVEVLRQGTIRYQTFRDESELPALIDMIGKDLSEPYSIYTYRYFILNWPSLCLLAYDDALDGQLIGVVVCKADQHLGKTLRGYIAMLAVDTTLRRRSIGSTLVRLAIKEMERMQCDEAVLETEITNVKAMRLYEKIGFLRDKRLPNYYLNGVDAFRLKLWLR